MILKKCIEVMACAVTTRSPSGVGGGALKAALPQKVNSKRLIALDAARGLAVIGMFVQHFALNERNSFVSGNTMILFILCSGISYSLMLQRMKEDHAAEMFRTRILSRSVFIDLIGYMIIMLNGPFAAVLSAYAMLFLSALPLARFKSRTLTAISGLLFIIGPPLMLVGLSIFSDAALLYDIAGGPLSALAWSPVFAAGMAIGRLKLKNTSIAVRLIAAGVSVLIPVKAFAVFVLPGIYQSFVAWLMRFPAITNYQADTYAPWPLNTQPIQWQMLFMDAPQGGSAFELLIGLGGCLILLGILLLAEKRLTVILKPLSAVGRVALTLYVSQFLIAWLLQLAGIDITSVDIGAIPFGDVMVAAAVVFAGCQLNRLPGAPLETMAYRFERFFHAPAE